MKRFIEKHSNKLVVVFGLIFVISVIIGLAGCGQGSLPMNNKNQVDATNRVADAINDKNLSTVVNNDVNNIVYPPSVDVNNTVYPPDVNTTVDVNNTVYPPSVDVNNTVYPPSVDVNNTVYPPSVDVNNTVEINNTVIVQYGDIIQPAFGSGTFDDPYDLRQARYSNINQESWFFSWLPNANCTIATYSSVVVGYAEALDNNLRPIDANCSVSRCSFNVSTGGSFMLDLILQEQNASVIFHSDCLKQPIYY